MRQAAKGPRPRRALYGGQREQGYGFFGGWWPDKPIEELLPWELGPDTKNVRLGFAGEVIGRPGVSRHMTASAGPSRMFFWRAKDKIVFQRGTSLYKLPAGFPVWSAPVLIANFTTSDVCGMCEFNGLLVVVHPVDGVFDYDDTTWTLRNATVIGSLIVPWQNKLWATGVTNRVWFSNLGSSATWTTASDFNDLRDVDDSKCTMLAVAPGEDIQGRSGLIVAKQGRGVHRIYDSSTGAQLVIDGDANCVGPRAFDALRGKIGFLGNSGFYLTDGVEVLDVSRAVKGRISRRVVRSVIANAAVGIHEDRFLLSFPTAEAGLGVNTMIVEFDPETGAWMPYSNDVGAGCFTKYDGADGSIVRTYAATSLGVSELESTLNTTDLDGDGDWTVAIETAPIALTPGYRSRVRAATFLGTGSWSIETLHDWRQVGYAGNPTRTLDMGARETDREMKRTIAHDFGVAEAVAFYLSGSGQTNGAITPEFGRYLSNLSLASIAVEHIPLALI